MKYDLSTSFVGYFIKSINWKNEKQEDNIIRRKNHIRYVCLGLGIMME